MGGVSCMGWASTSEDASAAVGSGVERAVGVSASGVLKPNFVNRSFVEYLFFVLTDV